MANIEILDGQGATKFVKSSGAGSGGDPFVTENTISGTVTTDGSGVTQPISGTVTANAGTGTFTTDGSGVTQPISGTVTANAGTGTFAVSGTVTANAGSGTQVTSSLNYGTRSIHSFTDSLSRGATSTIINPNGVIQSSLGATFVTVSNVVANNGDPVLLKRARMGVFGGAALDSGNFALAIFNAIPAGAQTEGSPIVFTILEASDFEQKINLNAKYVSTSTTWNISDDTSSYLIETDSGSTDLYFAIVSLNTWNTLGIEDFIVKLDFERLVD